MNRQTHTNLSQSYKKKYESARYSLLIVILFTLVNCALLIFGSDTYFLFSAQFVYFALFFAKLFAGKMPAEYYEDAHDFEPLPEGIYIAGIVFVVIALAVYFLCWFKSKDMHKNWLITSLVLFCIDVVANILFFGFSIDNIIDYVFAAYVIYSIASGIIAHAKLAKLPMPLDEPEAAPVDDFGFAEQDFTSSEENKDNENN